MIDSIKRKEKKEPEIWVDIGAGINPLGALLEKLGELKGKVYIGIDINLNKLLINRNFFKLLEVKAKKILHIVATAEKLPIENDSCDQVFLANFLGDPKISPTIKEKVLLEIIRILKPDGLLNIIEIYTPPQKEEVIKMIQSLGFEFVSDETMKLTIGADAHDWDPDYNYYLIFRKPI
jgi:ubiquinone/menaquinone biosynthesis C-methylase UbiE